MQRLSVPLWIAGPLPLGPGCQPVTVGVPIPKGALTDLELLCLKDDAGRAMSVQTDALARWSDGSVKWLLVDFLLDKSFEGTSWRLSQMAPGDQRAAVKSRLEVRQEDRTVLVETGEATFHVDRQVFQPLESVRVGDSSSFGSPAVQTVLTDRRGRQHHASIEEVEVETQGPLRATLRLEGTLPRCGGLRFRARVSFFDGTGLVRMQLTVHNPRRARHRGGLWDLGDPGSFFFRQLAVEVNLPGEANRVLWKTDPNQPLQPAGDGKLEIYQDSSGGENWSSRNHVNRHGRVPCRFQGYRVRTTDGEQAGLRASPVCMLQNDLAAVTVAVPEFWQQFPKALETDGQGLQAGGLRVGLFPRQWDDLFELQGGEQKTHTLWMHFGPGGADADKLLDWVHRPARVVSTPRWYADAGALPHLLPADEDADGRLRNLMDEALRGPRSLFAGRETIDEYGWRNFGDLYADHEDAYYRGPRPVISHYNNQFDVIHGAILQQMSSGDVAWTDLFDPLARHVVDVDIYHTTEDRAAYNGGLFWFTDHYLSARTSTHRTYSHGNKPPGRASYGGGPGCKHNFATGLLHYYYLTGDRDAMAAVLSLADWVIAMDDGRNSILSLLDQRPTGLASGPAGAEYHGPERGCGNSINVLLDGWLATGRRRYLDKAEALIRRSIHPHDDVASKNLLDVEANWSYTMHLAVLARYLDVKIDRDELDFLYAYSQSALLHYARWMLRHERPYFDHPEDLEYPTEAWAAQEFRKANVLRLASRHAEEPFRAELLGRGAELAERAWSDLLRFDTRTAARAVAIVMFEGIRDAYFRTAAAESAPHPAEHHDFGLPEAFIPQRKRVLARLKTLRGASHALFQLANPKNWAKLAYNFHRIRN